VVSDPDESLRVSDAERDVTLRTLGDHAAVGRLTLDELEERSGQALAAKTRGELAALTSDLPVEGAQGSRSAPARARDAQPKRPVRWMVAIMGGDEIDLREAEIEGGELTLNLVAIMGGANIYVPDSVDLEVGGFSLMGGHEEVGREIRPRPGAPAVRIRVYNLMGGATIYRLPPQARGRSLKEARHLAKQAERGTLPAPDERPALD
jgi:hypothetical protein